MHAKTLAHQLGISSYVLERNLSELSDQESLTAPEKGGNCLNWVLGHLVRSRLMALQGLGQEAPFPLEDFNAYDDRGGVPFGRETALPLAELKRRFKATQEPLVRGLAGMSPETMAKPAPFSPTGDPNETMGSLLVAFTFHEAYHVGQTGLLRRVVGKKGMITPAPAAAAT
ncbi:MAG: DinB family protein [Gemmatimonadales bacterium]